MHDCVTVIVLFSCKHLFYLYMCECFACVACMCTVVPIRPEHGMRSSERQVGAAMCVLGAATWILDTECGSPTGVAITPSH